MWGGEESNLKKWRLGGNMGMNQGRGDTFFVLRSGFRNGFEERKEGGGIQGKMKEEKVVRLKNVKRVGRE